METVGEVGGTQYIVEVNSDLGKGQFGVVKKAHPQHNPQIMLAAKIILRSNLNQILKQHLLQEITILKKINSANLISLLDVVETVHHYYLFFEYCNGGDL